MNKNGGHMEIWFLVFVAMVMAVGGVFWFSRAKDVSDREIAREIDDIMIAVKKIQSAMDDHGESYRRMNDKIDSITAAVGEKIADANRFTQSVCESTNAKLKSMDADVEIIKQRLKTPGKLPEKSVALSFTTPLAVEIIQKSKPKPLLERAGVTKQPPKKSK